jgi:hypothetical protein
MVLKFSEFINEARKDKKTLIETIITLLKDKPTVESSKNKYKDIYSKAAIIQYFKNNGMSIQNANDALFELENNKELKSDLKIVKVKDYKNDISLPYYYMDLDKSKVDSIKKEIEEKSKEEAAPILAKRKEVKKAASAYRNRKQLKKK